MSFNGVKHFPLVSLAHSVLIFSHVFWASVVLVSEIFLLLLLNELQLQKDYWSVAIRFLPNNLTVTLIIQFVFLFQLIVLIWFWAKPKCIICKYYN